MKYTYETTDNSCYVVATFSDEEVANNQLNILENNDLKNIIKPSHRLVDGDILISYNITSKISLEQATAKKKISKNGFINIIEDALSAIEDIEKHGLFNSGIVFDEKNVYVKAGTYESCFVYLPCAAEDVGLQPLKNFLLSLVMGSKIERVNDGFIQTLFDTLNKPNLCVNDLHAFCNEHTKGKMNAAKYTKNARFSVITPTMIDSESEILNSVYKKTEPKIDKSKETLQDNHSDIKRQVESNGKRKPKKYIFWLIQLFIALIITIISKSGFFDNADGTLNIKYLLIIIAVLCIVDFVIYREIFMSDKSSNNEDNAEKHLSDSATSKKTASTAERETSDSSENCPAPSPIHGVPRSLEQIYAGVQGTEYDDTVLLETESSCAHLEFFENGLFKKIMLDNDVVTVGKLSSQCDYAISNNKISKIHAEFIVRENEYFVKDCNSTNGTYINGSTQRIASNVEYQIYSGDRITLANVELTFKCL